MGYHGFLSSQINQTFMTQGRFYDSFKVRDMRYKEVLYLEMPAVIRSSTLLGCQGKNESKCLIFYAYYNYPRRIFIESICFQ
ncbi:hypothetical protein J6590_091947 [Homalodisca vitripennis]|nr:hypothetical protein J6590_091947 [Homalodisca vitripennis]